MTCIDSLEDYKLFVAALSANYFIIGYFKVQNYLSKFTLSFFETSRYCESLKKIYSLSYSAKGEI